jgi:hypothetical protein
LKKRLQIGWLVVFFLICHFGEAQTGHEFLPFSNKLLLNPSYAGFDKNTSVWSGLQLSRLPENRLNHVFSLTYDKWSDKLKAGTAFYFYQGLAGDVNTNTIGAGFSFSKPVKSFGEGQFIPSVNLNVYTAAKQWFVHFVDGMLDKEIEPPSPPGEEFLRYNLFRPRLGILWSSPDLETGISASYTLRQKLAFEEELPEETPLHLLFHLAPKMRGKRNGLTSKPYKIAPELIILYSEGLFLSRAGFQAEHTDRVFGLFVQNNYSDNVHGMAGMWGWRFDHFRINIAAGSAYSIPFQKMAFWGEVSLGLIVPYIDFNKKSPWASPKKLH